MQSSEQLLMDTRPRQLIPVTNTQAQRIIKDMHWDVIQNEAGTLHGDRLGTFGHESQTAPSCILR